MPTRTILGARINTAQRLLQHTLPCCTMDARRDGAPELAWRASQVMIITATLILLSLLALNHTIHGPGCWGLQPGGRWSATLFNIQVLVSALAICWSLYRVFWARGRIKFTVVAIAYLAAIAAAFSYMKVGWRMHTSIHGQGIENLPTFLLVSLVAIILGAYKWSLRGRPSS